MIQNAVLYCDDDLDDLNTFSNLLAEIVPNVSCVTIDDSEKLLTLLSEESGVPAIVFLDINMPKMNGIQTLKWLKKYPALKDVPCVMYTTSRDPIELEQCLSLGASSVMKKMYALDDIKKSLRTTLEQFCPSLFVKETIL